MHRPVEREIWSGRVDPESGAERWHQKVRILTPDMIDTGEPGIALLGICSDIGVSRNQGRAGAAKGPHAIRSALANVAWHLPVPCYDAGDLLCIDRGLEELQTEQAGWVERLLDLHHFPLVLGGGHEISFGSHLGLRRHLMRSGQRGMVGVVNFDAHFDLRKSEDATSGTPFLQIAETCQKEELEFRYFCLGVSEAANTLALFGRGASLGAQWLLDEQLAPWNLLEAEIRLRDFLATCDFVHLSIDLDVLPASVAPGVSAPAPRGVSLEVIEHLLHLIKVQAGPKLRLADLAECNPDFDIDGRTAKVAARLCHMIARKEPT